MLLKKQYTTDAMNNKGEIIFYQSEDSKQPEVGVEDETVWLTQTQISVLFKTDRS